MIEEQTFKERDIVVETKHGSIWMIECPMKKEGKLTQYGVSNHKGDSFFSSIELRLATEEEKKQFKPSPLSIPSTKEDRKRSRKLARRLKEVFDRIKEKEHNNATKINQAITSIS